MCGLVTFTTKVVSKGNGLVAMLNRHHANRAFVGPCTGSRAGINLIFKKNTHQILLLATVLLYGFAVAAGYYLGSGPAVAPVISLEVINSTGETIDRVVVRHGGANVQEEIVLMRLANGEHREIGVNHEIGAGFNVEVFRKGNEMISVCVGKRARTARHQLTVLPNNLRFIDSG